MIYYITGGERSGKSSYAHNLALSLSSNPIYLATARNWDDDFDKRIQRHQGERDERWETLEIEKEIGVIDIAGRVIVLDCITLWLTNWYHDEKHNVESCLSKCKHQLAHLFKTKNTLIIISNEIGMGVHAQSHIGRKFTELQGWINQFIATQANEAIFMVSGLPISLKNGKSNI